MLMRTCTTKYEFISLEFCTDALLLRISKHLIRAKRLEWIRMRSLICVQFLDLTNAITPDLQSSRCPSEAYHPSSRLTRNWISNHEVLTRTFSRTYEVKAVVAMRPQKDKFSAPHVSALFCKSLIFKHASTQTLFMPS